MDAVYSAAIPVYAVPGNHEYECASAQDCVTAWTETMVPMLPSGRTDNDDCPGREYSFTFNNTFFIGLDQIRTMPASYRGNDVAWIESELAVYDTTKYQHVITFGHIPQFMLLTGWTPDQKNNREAFWNALEGVKSHMYFTGHTHTYALGLTTTADGDHSIYQILAGSAGAPFEEFPSGSWDGVYYESDRATSIDRNNIYEGYALVTIEGAQVSMEWRYYDPVSETFKSRSGFTYTQQ